MKIVVTDIHGSFRLFSKILEKFPARENQYILLGDYIDRGPDSRLVVEEVLELRREHGAVLLKGNHEEMLFEYLETGDESWLRTWVQNGGRETLESYGMTVKELKAAREKEEANLFFTHCKELKESCLDFWIDTPHLYAHAAMPEFVSPGLPELGIRGDGHLWNRPEDGQKPFPKGVKLSVHGHTPMENAPAQLNFSETQSSLYLDTGSFRSEKLLAFFPETMSVEVFS